MNWRQLFPSGVLILATTCADRPVPDISSSTVCSLADNPVMRVESSHARKAILLSIVDVDRMSDGHLVVLSRGTQEVLVFTPDGQVMRSLGRQGEGPGEFMDPIDLEVVAGDSILVWDWGLARFSLFGPDGSHARSFGLRPPTRNPTGVMGVLEGAGIAVGSHDVRPFDTRLTPQFLQILLYDWSGNLLDTLATLPYGQRALVSGSSGMMTRPVFESRGVFSTSGNRLFMSNGASPEVRVHRGDRLESVLRWDPGDLAVRPEDVEAYRARWLESVGDGWAPLLREQLDAVPAADAFPAVMEIQGDERGGVWVGTYAKPGSTARVWLGFAETGAFMCSLAVPRALQVLHFDSSAFVGVHRDEMDLESIEVRPFRLP